MSAPEFRRTIGAKTAAPAARQPAASRRRGVVSGFSPGGVTANKVRPDMVILGPRIILF